MWGLVERGICACVYYSLTNAHIACSAGAHQQTTLGLGGGGGGISFSQQHMDEVSSLCVPFASFYSLTSIFPSFSTFFLLLHSFFSFIFHPSSLFLLSSIDPSIFFPPNKPNLLTHSYSPSLLLQRARIQEQILMSSSSTLSSSSERDKLKEYVDQLYITYTGKKGIYPQAPSIRIFMRKHNTGDPASTNFVINSLLDKSYSYTQVRNTEPLLMYVHFLLTNMFAYMMRLIVCTES